jgi:hypothetical protein
MHDLMPGLTARNGLTAPDVARVLPALGITADLGEEFPCVLPSYEGTLSSVVDPESLRFQTLYEGAPKTWLSLAEVFASVTARRVVDLTRTNVLHARWWERLRHEAGLLPLSVPHLALPDRASPAAVIAAQGFALAWALKDRHHPGQPITFSRRFAADWCGLPERAAYSAIGELTALGAILPAGHTVTSGGPNAARTYLPAFAVAEHTPELEEALAR